MRGRDPLIYGNCLGVEIPLEYDSISFSGIEMIGTVQDHVVQGSVLDERGYY